MSTRYHLVDKDFKSNIMVDSAVLVEDGVVWDQGEIQMSLNYDNVQNVLVDNDNENYLSANDDGNSTQYFSILGTTNENELNDLNDITLYTDGNLQIPDQDNVNVICTSDDQQCGFVAVPESEDLYAFQIAYDAEGNVQKYRFMLRLNENGDYETVPNSLELLPDEMELPGDEVLPVEEPQSMSDVDEMDYENHSKVAYRNGDLIVKKEEHESTSNYNDDSYHGLEVNEDEDLYDTEMFPEHVESKLAVIRQDEANIHKLEAPSGSSEESNPAFESSDYTEENENLASVERIPNVANTHSLSPDALSLNHFDTVYALQHTVAHENEAASHKILEGRHLIINDNNEQECENTIIHNEDSASADLPDDVNENESEEEFQVVEGVHVTADNEEPNELATPLEPNDTVLKMHENISFLNNALDDLNIRNALKKNSNKGSKSLMYLVVKDPEKENVASFADVGQKILKANPRSVLKSSYTFFEPKKDNPKLENQEAKIEKKTIKMKDGKGKPMQNFLAKTTIILAPVRQERMPRKQTIKPVTRADEEIVVQEVVVSSNGIVETKEGGVIKSKVLLTPTDFVQVSDSDEDYMVRADRKKRKKKKKRRSKVTKIVISDTEDDDLDESVVEIDLSVDSDVEGRNGQDNLVGSKQTEQEISKSVKKRRGRPPKRPSSSQEESGSSSSSKRLKSTNESESSDFTTPKKCELPNINTKWSCSSCPKVFPSEGSLKTHMQYHSHHERVNKNKQFKKPVCTISNPSSYKCKVCFESFKNNYLLLKHTKEHNNPSKFECSFCWRLFSDQLQLTNHRRSHIKQRMFNTTTLPKDSPKSKKSIASNPNLSQPQEKYKCSFCSKIFTSQILLNAHSNVHKRFICLSCSSTFMSKLALEDHVQHRCVKPARTVTNLSLKNKPTCSTSKPVSEGVKKNQSPPPSPDKRMKTPSSAKQINMKCDKCSLIFKSHKNLFIHKVLQHGLETPDRNIKLNRNKTLVHKELGKHASVPISKKLRNAFATLKTGK